MEKIKKQVRQVEMEIEHSSEAPLIGDNLLKVIDEVNYCTYTLLKEKRNQDMAAEKTQFQSPPPKPLNP